MGLGGYLTWTAAAREIVKTVGPHVKCMPVEQHGHFLKPIDSPVFQNNPDFFIASNGLSGDYFVFPLVLNNPDANYCKKDTPEKAYHAGDRHIIEQVCAVYGIDKPELKCYLNPLDSDLSIVDQLIEQKSIGSNYITIEPISKTNYTKNRAYPFEKWQYVVDKLKDKIDVVQVGSSGSRLLNNVIDCTGKTSFLQAADLISRSRMFLSSEGGLVHAATAFDTTSLVVITGYQNSKMVSYPQNINVDISNHGPCGLKSECPMCAKEAQDHDPDEILDKVVNFLCL